MARGLQLFRTIMRLHRDVLPREMRGLGDAYVRCATPAAPRRGACARGFTPRGGRAEFRAHSTGRAKVEHLEKFFVEWAGYAEAMRRQASCAGSHERIGRPLSGEEEARLGEEQRRQLARLREEVTEAYGGARVGADR